MTIYKHLSYLQKARFLPRQIQRAPRSDLKLIVIIPVHNEPSIRPTLDSLAACIPPDCGVEVILVLNASEQANSDILKQNQETAHLANRWALHAAPFFQLHLIECSSLPKKHAGVGLARKIGMDEGIDRFEQIDQLDGIMVCLDADCQVAPNYFQAIVTFFNQRPRAEAASIWFEHPLTGTDFPPNAYQAVAHFELSLRYYIQALRHVAYPYAIHAIGSAIAVRASAYQKYGGMNRRQGAEDFHFLHKFTPQGQVFELHHTTVYPQARPSRRAPLGTGQAISSWLEQESDSFWTYDLAIFHEIRTWLTQLSQYTEKDELPAHPSLLAFLAQEKFPAALPDIRKHATKPQTFAKRFFAWLDPLKMKRMVHFMRDHSFPNQDLIEVAGRLYEMNHKGTKASKEVFTCLAQYRKWEK